MSIINLVTQSISNMNLKEIIFKLYPILFHLHADPVPCKRGVECNIFEQFSSQLYYW